jgi:transposase InsO family protein
MGDICQLFGYTRQAHYKRQKQQKKKVLEQAIVLKQVETIRNKMPRIGTIKLYDMLQPCLREHRIKMGRDKLYDLLSCHGLLIRRKRRRKPITTDSNHPFYRYENLVRYVQVTRPNQVWVSDITYIRLTSGFCYLNLVTDACSRKIVGYCLYKDLSSEGTLSALQMALQQNPRRREEQLIHHSDRGIQYCCGGYTALLRKHHIAISMTQNGDPYENALAERVNGILKQEFNLNNTYPSLQSAQQTVDQSIKYYNELRPHLSLQLRTPLQVHQNNTPYEQN